MITRGQNNNRRPNFKQIIPLVTAIIWLIIEILKRV